jgi:hypothetical protein
LPECCQPVDPPLDSAAKGWGSPSGTWTVTTLEVRSLASALFQ